MYPKKQTRLWLIDRSRVLSSELTSTLLQLFVGTVAERLTTANLNKT